MDMKTFNRGNLTTAVLLALTIGMSQTVFASDTVYENAATKSADVSDVSVVASSAVSAYNTLKLPT